MFVHVQNVLYRFKVVLLCCFKKQRVKRSIFKSCVSSYTDRVVPEFCRVTSSCSNDEGRTGSKTRTRTQSCRPLSETSSHETNLHPLQEIEICATCYFDSMQYSFCIFDYIFWSIFYTKLLFLGSF